MKRLFAILLVVLLALPVCAAGGGYVTDEAGILTSGEEAQLEERAQEISESAGCGVYIVIVEAFEGGSVMDYAQQVYLEEDLGLGTGRDGILLLLSMAERDYAFITYGTTAQGAITDAADARISDAFLAEFRDDQWYDGFRAYLDGCEDAMKQAASGTSIGGSYYPEEHWEAPAEEASGMSLLSVFLLIVVLPCGIAGVVCLMLTGQLRSVKRQTSARAYVSGRGLQLTHREDFFVNRTVRRQRIPRNDGPRGGGHHGGGGGGGRSSGGFRGSSGKF